MRYLYYFLFSISLLFFSNELKASHLLGAEITYDCVGPNQYLVTLSYYRDCNGISSESSQTLSYSSSTCGVNTSITLSRVGSPQDITPLCPGQQSACGGNGNVGIQRVIYQGTINLPPGCGDDWVLSWSLCCRNGIINTLNSPANQNMGVSTLLDNTVQPCNNSAVFNNDPAALVCVNQPFIYNHGVSDSDGDSLFFSLGNCFTSGSNSVNYSGGFNGTNPLTTASGVSINPNTGALSFTPTQVQVGVICVVVEEYRNGVKVGEVNRDMQFNVLNCSNVPPQASGVDGAPNNDPVNFETSICANGELCFDIDFFDSNTSDNLTVSWNQEIPSASFTIQNNNSTAPSATFCWTPLPSNIGTNFFTVNVVDDACPVIASGTYTYVIEVLPSPNTLDAGVDQDICFGESTTLTATSAPAASSFTWSPVQSLNTSSGASVTATPVSTTTYEVEAAFPDGCNLKDIVTVNVRPLPAISITPLNPFNCSGQNNVITATAPNAVSYDWVPGPLVGQTINVAPTSTTTYTVTATSNFGCQSDASTTVTIAAPAENACNVLYVSPSGTSGADGTRNDPMDLETAMTVGACNGTIIKMAVGDYVTDTTINRVTSYLTLEGGFDAGTNWEKVSTAGATRILRTATMTTSTVNGNGVDNEAPPYPPNPNVTAMNVLGQTGFRFQDITVEVEGLAGNSPILGYRGVDTRGVVLENCDGYNIVRTRVRTGDASDGSNEGGGTNPTPGGSSYGLTLINNGAGGNLIASNILAGSAGSGGEFVYTNLGTFATNGSSQNILTQGGGAALVQNQSSFNLDGQPVIRMDDIACTNVPMNFIGSSSSAWTFGLDSDPPSANGITVSSMYSSLGRKNINFNSNVYTGFANILLDDQVIPEFTTSIPIVNGQYRVCVGESVSFEATNGGVGYTYIWSDGTNSITGVGEDFESFVVELPDPGVFTITLNYETSCCGLSLPASIEVYVEDQPEVVLPPDQTICLDESGVEITASGDVTGGFTSWTPSSGLSNNNTNTVTANPAQSTSYQVTMTDSTGLCVSNGFIDVDVVDLELAVSSVDATCGPDGEVSVSVSGGSGSYTYNWIPGDIPTPDVSGLQVGSYSVEVTDDNFGCVATESVFINPSAGTLVGFISNSQNVSCFGLSDGEITVSVVGGQPPFTYDWGPNGTFTSNDDFNTISNLPAGEYDVLVTDDLGCTFAVTGFINEPQEVVFAFDSISDPTCVGVDNGFISVTTDGGVAPYTYTWDFDLSITDNFVDGLPSGTYTIFATDANGCEDSLAVDIQAPPIPETIIDTTLCEGDIFDLIDGSDLILSNDTTIIDTLADIDDCLVSVTTNITVLPLPIASISLDTTICSGDDAEVVFSGTPNATVTYNVDGGQDETLQLDGTGNASVNTGTLSSTVTYNLMGVVSATTPACEAVVSESVTITVLELPTASIFGDTTICDGDATIISFEGTSNAIVTYNNGGNNETIQLDSDGNASLNTGNLSLTTSYELISVALDGIPSCEQPLTEEVVVEVLELPTASISGDATICSGETSEILITGTPNATVEYEINGTTIVEVTLDVNGEATFTTNALTSTSTYELLNIQLDGEPSCPQEINGEVATVEVLELPAAEISAMDACLGDAVDVMFTGTPGATVSYNIDGGNTLTIVLDSNGEASVSTGTLSSDITYNLENVAFAEPIFCETSLSESVEIQVVELPIAEVFGTTSICFGESTTITFEATPNSEITYILNGDESTIEVDASGTAEVDLTALEDDVIIELVEVSLLNSFGCGQAVSGTAEVTILPLPTPELFANPDSIFMGESSIISVIGGESFEWSPISSTADSVEVSPMETTEYFVTVTNEFECESDGSIVVVVLEPGNARIPDAFTPNGDGINDVFEVFNSAEYAEIEMAVYNRWGEELHRGFNDAHGWDGTYRGEAQPLDVYIYKVTVTTNGTNETYRLMGSFSLLR